MFPRIERYLHTDYDSKTYEELRRYPHTIHLGRGPQQVEGWLCDTSQKLRLRVEDEGTRPEFAECVLAGAMPSKGRGALDGRNRVAADGEASSTRMGTASR